jgi:hypothetical protein
MIGSFDVLLFCRDDLADTTRVKPGCFHREECLVLPQIPLAGAVPWTFSDVTPEKSATRRSGTIAQARRETAFRAFADNHNGSQVLPISTDRCRANSRKSGYLYQ